MYLGIKLIMYLCVSMLTSHLNKQCLLKQTAKLFETTLPNTYETLKVFSIFVRDRRATSMSLKLRGLW